MAAAPPAAALPDELVQEILARLPPDDPACLLRAFLVCKAWGCAVSLPSFRRRLHDLHRPPPLLGFLPSRASEGTPSFIPTTASSFSLDAADCLRWRALDYRHGRTLFLSRNQHPEEFLVWEPITGAQKHVPVPAAFDVSYGAELPDNRPTAAVLCAADGCDHRDCFGGPFRVVFVFEDDTWEDQDVKFARVYSSETGAWGELTSLPGESIQLTENSSVLVGSSLLYFGASGSILEYDLTRHVVTLLSPPYNCRYPNLMLTEDGVLGVIEDLDPHLRLWAREASEGRWVLTRTIYLRNLFPPCVGLNEGFRVVVMGFIEGANALFVASTAGFFIIELQSEQVRKA
ncbi:hypothetical protein VPH35_093901 [Triticum aestivum]